MPTRSAKAEGTVSRFALTNAICRRASHRRTPTDADSASTKMAVNREGVTEAALAGVRQSTPSFYATRSMAQDANNLIWIDMEMTGLSPATDRIIEVALIVTDA